MNEQSYWLHGMTTTRYCANAIQLENYCPKYRENIIGVHHLHSILEYDFKTVFLKLSLKKHELDVAMASRCNWGQYVSKSVSG